MNSGEIFPVLGGLVLGLVLGVVRPSWRNAVACVAVLLFGYLTSAAAGELRISGFYGLLDATLVAIFAEVGFIVYHGLRPCSIGT